jgi:hypothetical protein
MAEINISSYQYWECGHPNVYLVNASGMNCQDCGAISPIIKASETVHALIGQAVCLQPFLLSGRCISFLRKHCGKSQDDWAKFLRMKLKVYKEFENDPASCQASRKMIDLLIRLLYSEFMKELGRPFSGMYDKVLEPNNLSPGSIKFMINAKNGSYWYE